MLPILTALKLLIEPCMKRFLLSSLTTIVISSAFSQSLYHSVGLTSFSSGFYGGGSQGGFAGTYTASYHFMDLDNASLSVGMPLSVGFSLGENAESGMNGNRMGYLVNAPVFVNYNMGAGSFRDNDSQLGFFIGGGMSYMFQTLNTTYYEGANGSQTTNTNISSFGPAANAGVRFAPGYSSHTAEIRIMLMRGMDNSRSKVFAIGASYNF